MVILVSNLATDHCHRSVTKGYYEKKRPTVLLSVFASPRIFGHAPTLVSASPPAFFGDGANP